MYDIVSNERKGLLHHMIIQNFGNTGCKKSKEMKSVWIAYIGKDTGYRAKRILYP